MMKQAYDKCLRRLVVAAAVSAACGVAQPGSATPTLRYQADLNGDFSLVGNALAQDCANGVPAPIVGTVGACGTNVSDSAPDVFWRSDAANGTTVADLSIASLDARSTAILTLPPGAEVTYARLYWAASNPTADTI